LWEIGIARLDEHTRAQDVAELLAPLHAGRPLGLLSEAGCPGVADPGAELVRAAHAAGFRVAPLVGPSSIVLALMGSGLEGQRFAFCGYLPRERAARLQRIRELESRSREQRETEIFIETPYRNAAVFSALLEACRPETRLCVAQALTQPEESIQVRRIGDWRGRALARPEHPSVFLLQAA
jgi:16S rRNA (cytidine1402-2'-O)-methyltransferase